jgi:hypothetical protein
VDPLAESYPIYATYQYAGNSPLGNIDIDGLEPGGQLSPEMQSLLDQATQAGVSPAAPGPAGTLSERKITRLERWRDNVASGKAGFVSRMAYHVINDVWVGAQDMTPGVDRPRNMGGDDVSGTERQAGAVGFMGVVMNFLTGGLGKMITLPEVEITAAGTAKGGNHVLYTGLDASGKVRYIGMTGRDPSLRFREHVRSGTGRSLLDYRVVDGATGLTKKQARI